MSDDAAPSAQLALEVADALIAVGLLRADVREKVAEQIASGKMKGNDWQSEIDLAVEKAGGE
jgi:hypothetical protein